MFIQIQTQILIMIIKHMCKQGRSVLSEDIC